MPLRTRLKLPRPPRRHVWDRRRASDSVPAGAVAVLSVQSVGGEILAWTFDSLPVDVPANCPQLAASVDGESAMLAPSFVQYDGGNVVVALYPVDEFQAGARWQIADAPVGLSFAGGTAIVPQSGNVEF